MFGIVPDVNVRLHQCQAPSTNTPFSYNTMKLTVSGLWLLITCMTNVRRYYEGGWYFFTLCTHKRQKILTRPDVLAALRNAVRETMRTHPFEIEAWVVMPDHLHCVLRIMDTNAPVRWSKIKALTSKALPEFSAKNYSKHYKNNSRQKRQLSSLWQKGYWEHTIRNEKELYMYLLYCCYNPVKHRYVSNATEWPYSTLNRYLRNNRYPPDWAYINESWVDSNLAAYDP